MSVDAIDLEANLITDTMKNDIRDKILEMEQSGDLPGVMPEAL